MRAASQSVGDIVGDLMRDISTLMREEIALAKAEAKEQASRAGKGVGMLGGAGYAGSMVLLFLSLALMFVLGDLTEHLGWGALIVAVIWGIVAAILYFSGRSALKEVEPMPETVDSVKQIPDALHTKEENR
ncbi:phage holin family protein [Agrococcus sp. HG114]|uniref:phage holin family protein n=1 Tax=Agrococcus sp. HG114 TaxID=2969757 RepID=UPI00215A21ED|nr:phage holin family protein [Agrococcus sp. HG114]MCR8671579.1 phage holin family protein [Agrococcus sp. HG114]